MIFHEFSFDKTLTTDVFKLLALKNQKKRLDGN